MLIGLRQAAKQLAYPLSHGLQVIQSRLYDLVILTECRDEGIEIFRCQSSGVAHAVGQNKSQALQEVVVAQNAGIQEAAEKGFPGGISGSFLPAKGSSSIHILLLSVYPRDDRA